MQLPYNGAVTVVDSVFDLRHGGIAIDSNRPVHASQTLVHGAATVVRLEGREPLAAKAGEWTRLREFTSGGYLHGGVYWLVL